MNDVNIRVHLGGQTQIVTSAQLQSFATAYELDRIAPGRYSSLFVLNLLLLSEVQRIDPVHVVVEMKALEGKGHSFTKPATEFRGQHLQGLWHKHFLPPLPSAMAHNILNQLGKNGLGKIAEEVFGPHMGKIATKEMLDEFTAKIVDGSLSKRTGDNRLTGEWIVFAKEDGLNYYLGIWPHAQGDEQIAQSLRAACLPEFPFLKKYLL
jgi:hypothetical protein